MRAACRHNLNCVHFCRVFKQETVQAAIVLTHPVGEFMLSCSEELARPPFALPSALLQTTGAINELRVAAPPVIV